MCGIFGIQNNENAAKLTFLGLYGLQHRGEESTGIAVYDNDTKPSVLTGLGQVEKVFKDKYLETMTGNTAIGHVRYSTTGSSGSACNVQPFSVNHKENFMAIAHNGNLTNTRKLCDALEETGSIFQTSMDSELIIHLLAKSEKKDLKEKFLDAFSKVRGAYSALFLVNDILIGARDPFGVRPLSLGKIDDSYVLASETCVFDLVGAEYIREIEAGEIIFIYKDGSYESICMDNDGSVIACKIGKYDDKRKARCIFEQIYFARPDSRVFGESVYLQRKKLGNMLAREFKVNADMVLPMPDSGSVAALGYAEEAGIPFELGIVRNHYIGRTFIQPSQFMRDFRVKIKLNPIRDLICGKKIILVEDSIVRGTTSKNRIKTLRAAGAKEIHMMVSCPPIISPCFYGIDFPTKQELIAFTKTVEEIKEFIGVDSLCYLSLEGMKKALLEDKEDGFCDACFTGNYPIEHSHTHASKYVMEQCNQ